MMRIDGIPRSQSQGIISNVYIGGVLATFISSLYKLMPFEKREPKLRKCPNQPGRYANLGSVFLNNDQCGWAEPKVSGASPGQVVLNYIKSMLSRLGGESQQGFLWRFCFSYCPDFLQ